MQHKIDEYGTDPTNPAPTGIEPAPRPGVRGLELGEMTKLVSVPNTLTLISKLSAVHML